MSSRRVENSIQCVTCGQWIPCRRGRLKLDNHIFREHPEAWKRMQVVVAELRGEERQAETETTVKRPDLFGIVHDTHATETELNGWRETQAPLL